MQKLFVGFLALAFVVGLAAASASAKPADWFAGVFEAPLVADGGAELPGSEGKIGRDGSWKVEASGLETTEETYQICLETKTDDDPPILLRDGVLITDGNLKEVCIATDVGGCVSGGGFAVPGGDHQAPRLQVREAYNGVCTGDVVAESGLTVVPPSE